MDKNSRQELLENFGLWCVIAALFISGIELFNVIKYWLIYGIWTPNTPCMIFQLFCEGNTEYLGLNKILTWFGHHDISYLAWAIAIPIAWWVFRDKS